MDVINYCLDKHLSQSIEIMKNLQSHLVQVRTFNVSNVDDSLTNFVMVDHAKQKKLVKRDSKD